MRDTWSHQIFLNSCSCSMRRQNSHWRALFCIRHPTDIWPIMRLRSVWLTRHTCRERVHLEGSLFSPLRVRGIQSDQQRDGVSAGFSFQTSRRHSCVLFLNQLILAFNRLIRCGSCLTGLKSCSHTGPVMTLGHGRLRGSNLWLLDGKAKPYIVFVWSSSYRVWCCFRVNYQFKSLTEHVQQRGSFRGAFRRLGSKCITLNKLESRFWEGDEDGGKLCVYGEQTPGRSGGEEGGREGKKREGVKEELEGQARSAMYSVGLLSKVHICQALRRWTDQHPSTRHYSNSFSQSLHHFIHTHTHLLISYIC